MILNENGRLDVVILGASGYGGGELLRLLITHPRVRSLRVVAKRAAGEPVDKVHPHLRGLISGRFADAADWEALARNGGERSGVVPVVFAAMPHGEFGRQSRELEAAWSAQGLAERLTVIDLSADFRLPPDLYERHYGAPHPWPEQAPQWRYGFAPREGAALRGARRIANPGCFATALQLALLPFAHEPDLGLVAVSAATGSSGSGNSLSETTHHPTRAHDFRAYKVLNHQHEGEVHQLFRRAGGTGYRLAFVPQSAPLVRGIFAVVTFAVPAGRETDFTEDALRTRFAGTYEGSPFVRMVEGSPRVASVAGSNFADLSITARDGVVTVLCALDNLGLGMAGQAIWNMNLALGFPETEGLRVATPYPG